MKVDIIIPTYRPDDTFCLLLQKLQEQTFVVHRVILLNTEEALWKEAIERYPIEEMLEKLPCPYALMHVSREEFDHGGTRQLGADTSGADVVIFMTQDAVPADAYMVEHLVAPFSGVQALKSATEDDNEQMVSGKSTAVVAVSYARQLPREDCSVVERYTRQFNYPDISRVKTKQDIPTLGIKTFFCSDVCAAYRKDIFEKLGGFETPVIFNEDMFYAAKAVEEGYGVFYAANAEVIHSHNYSMKQQFRRNFDLAVSQKQHPEIFEQVSSESEGIRLVISTMKHLCRIGKPHLIWNLGWQSVAKYAGYFAGKRYEKLSHKQILKYSMSPCYWKKIWQNEM